MESWSLNPKCLNLKKCDRWTVICSIIFLLAWGGSTFLFHFLNKDLFQRPKDFPIFNAGIYAKGFFAIGCYTKGFFAIGCYAEGIVAIGFVTVGLISFSVAGLGAVVFMGALGGVSVFGIYGVGMSIYCFNCIFSISLWTTKYGYVNYGILNPICCP